MQVIGSTFVVLYIKSQTRCTLLEGPRSNILEVIPCGSPRATSQQKRLAALEKLHYAVNIQLQKEEFCSSFVFAPLAKAISAKIAPKATHVLL